MRWRQRPGPLEQALAGGRPYRRPCTACNTSSALLKVSVSAPLVRLTTSCGVSLLWAVEATSSLSAGKFTLGRNCWSWSVYPQCPWPQTPRKRFGLFSFLSPSSSKELEEAVLLRSKRDGYEDVQHRRRLPHLQAGAQVKPIEAGGLFPALYSAKCLEEGKFSEVHIQELAYTYR